MRAEHSKYFVYIATGFVALLLVSNTTATKIFQLGPLAFPGAILIFPFSYIFGDILTEVYGYRASRRIVWCGFAAQVFMALTYWIIQLLPPAPFWQHQEAYVAILGAVPRIVLASIVAYLVGEFCNSYVLSKMKVWTKGKYLWSRTIGSTIVGEGVDTILFSIIGFAGTMPIAGLVAIAASAYLFKVAYEIIATPLTYFIVAKLKQKEGIDVYDRDISYNPFTLS